MFGRARNADLGQCTTKNETASYSPRPALQEEEGPTSPLISQRPPHPKRHGAKRHLLSISPQKNQLRGGGGPLVCPGTRPSPSNSNSNSNQSLRRLRRRDAMRHPRKLRGTGARNGRRDNWPWTSRMQPRSSRCRSPTRQSSSETRKCARRKFVIPQGLAGAAPACAVGAPAPS